MYTKAILIAFLLTPFFTLSAQDVIPTDVNSKEPLIVFESVSFSAEQGSITITCKDARKLTSFEIIGENAHFSFEWNEENPADRFPMKLNIKPGKVIIKYKMLGEKKQPIELNLEAHDALKLTI